MGSLNCCTEDLKLPSNFSNPLQSNIGIPAPMTKSEYSQIAQTKKSIAQIQQTTPYAQESQESQQKRDRDYPSSAYAVEVSLGELPKLSPEAQETISKMSRLTGDLNSPGTSLHPYYIHKKKVYYVGQWKNGKPEGKGKVYFPSGAYFEGEFIDGVAECDDGLFIYPDGSYYRGNIRNSAPNGVGRLVYRNSQMVYDGTWVNHRPHGTGVERFKDGSQYSGNFMDGLKHGQGMFKWANGTTYTGNFTHGNIEGQGVQTMANGDRYEGEFKKSRRWGDGILSTRIGKFSGQFYNDRRNGQGEFEWSNLKRIYKGGFSKGKIHGKGQVFLENGQIIRGTWDDGNNIRISNVRQS